MRESETDRVVVLVNCGERTVRVWEGVGWLGGGWS